MKFSRFEAGYMMIEVLITMAVITLGMLGIALLVANGLRANQSSSSRLQASWLAENVVERMRANRFSAESGAYITASCPVASGTSIASTDLNEWCASISSLLPAGNGSISYNSALAKFSVTVFWDDSSRFAESNRIINSGRVVLETRL